MSSASKQVCRKVARRFCRNGFTGKTQALSRPLPELEQRIIVSVDKFQTLVIELGVRFSPIDRSVEQEQYRLQLPFDIFSSVPYREVETGEQRLGHSINRMAQMTAKELDIWCDLIFSRSVEPFFDRFRSLEEADKLILAEGQRKLAVSTSPSYRRHLGIESPGQWVFTERKGPP